MGLDMYLYLRKYEYVSKYDKPEKCIYPEEMKELEKEISESNFVSIKKKTDYQVGYWRKDNAIHNYFVQFCGNGIDECQEIYVGLEAAENLVKVCDEVLKDHTKAEDLLPTCDGFFFGGTEYDEWYFESLKYTRDLLSKLIKFVQEHKEYCLIYQASW